MSLAPAEYLESVVDRKGTLPAGVHFKVVQQRLQQPVDVRSKQHQPEYKYEQQNKAFKEGHFGLCDSLHVGYKTEEMSTGYVLSSSPHDADL